MKKDYLKPSISEIEMKSCQPMLAGSSEVKDVSGNADLNYGGPGEDRPAYSRKGGFYMDDDFEDEE